MNDIFDEYTELLGAYALDAVEPDERDAIERHLVDCPRCRAEVAEHREVAAFLAQTGADAPEGVWDRIAAELSPPAPPLRMTFSREGDERVTAAITDAPASDSPADAPTSTTAGQSDDVVAPVVSLAARRKMRGRTMAAVVAVAACIVAALGFVTVAQSQRLNKLETALDDRSVETLANDVVARSAVEVSLSGEGGDAQAVIGESGQGYLIMDDVPTPPEGDLYQLWGKVDGTVLSLGTFGGGNSVVPFSVDPSRLDDIELFAVTQETAPGVVSSTKDPVMVGTI